ncbi:4-hydroxythreonine-4-phosphate dehydrogenase PdxA [Methyloceanibacter marginalis]|uniref:4-hydroxythreonine-4-phosphate dehydrogenase PdxA n=1 Tax=Methyloceanibacter marginalis TaxID=1774971 RepID=UPI000AE693C5
MGPTAKPLALTLGDPAGIGPDVTLLAFAARNREAIPPFVLIGDETVLAERAETLGLSIPIAKIAAPADAAQIFPDALPVLPLAVSGSVVAGQPSLEAMDAVKRSIETAVGLVQEGEARAVVTNQCRSRISIAQASRFRDTRNISPRWPPPRPPRSSRCWWPVRSRWCRRPSTSLEDVERTLTRDLLAETIKITDRDLRRFFGYGRPRLAVSGPNPHAGEQGSLGREEVEIIEPVIAEAQAQGLDVSGPYPADTLFHEAARQRYDAAICMYHDQALVPFKTLAFEEGVNVTLGLPFVRTSPDHGTAFDIAGTGKTNPRSLIEALRLASAMSETATDEA